MLAGPHVHADRSPTRLDEAARILVEDVSFTFTGAGGEDHPVLHHIDVTVEPGSFVSLIGPSGCGKSTVLRLLAGLLAPTSGRLLVAGLPPTDAARARKIGLVSQEPNLLPWKSALENAAFLLEIADKSLSRAETRTRGHELLKLVGLEAAAAKRPNQLSGGMRQRVAIARALALDPAILLMDEPFGALDAITREEMSYFLLDLWERTHKTVVFVTHSIDEAVFLSSKVHVMGSGRIIDTIPVPLPYPRDEQSFELQAFSRTEARLRALLLESHGKRRST